MNLTAALAACTSTPNVKLTFYGWPDNDPPSSQIAYPDCGRASAGGIGTYADPLTMATAPGEFAKCEILYVPYLQKYVRFEDTCAQCTSDFGAGGRLHIDLWTGDDRDGGGEQVECEDALTPDADEGVVRRPARDYTVDATPLYQKGASCPCRTRHVYKAATNAEYCKGAVRLA